jgi:hypothetical protein
VGLGWSHQEILSLTHQERARWVQQINRMNTRRNMLAAQPRKEA